jgi:hypothetical protein
MNKKKTEAGAEQPFLTCKFILIELFLFTISEDKNSHFKTNQLAGQEWLLCARFRFRVSLALLFVN